MEVHHHRPGRPAGQTRPARTRPTATTRHPRKPHDQPATNLRTGPPRTVTLCDTSTKPQYMTIRGDARVNDGQDRTFIERVSHALRVNGWRVDPIRIDSPDLLTAYQSRLGEDSAALVICIDRTDPLRVEDVNELVSEHRISVDNEYDELLLVTSIDIPRETTRHLKRLDSVRGRALSQLLTGAMDLTVYLNDLVTGYEESSDGLSHYYQLPQASNYGSMLDVVIDWIDLPTNPDPTRPKAGQPIAILGAYGSGKSSFSTYLSALLARKAIKDRKARIPILIRLGEIAGEQSAEGLLGKHFTATNSVPGYSFAAFNELNRSGRLVIILDGFDEMKELLTWREFKFNLKELNRLHCNTSRLLILGRPTAFETDSEQAFALHGVRQTGRIETREPGWPDYHELEISPLSESQMRTFLIKYLTYRESPVARDVRLFNQLWDKIRSGRLRDMARRPVQLRMLAHILPSFVGQIEEIDVGILYELFIDELIKEIIEREEEKNSRLAFSGKERLDFLSEFAFWLWRNHESVAIGDQVPEAIIKPFVHGRNPEAVRRDLLVGSPLDRRSGERFRFPHRSFQEFLVAKEIWARLRAESLELADANSLITKEVADFMVVLRHSGQVVLAMQLLRKLSGSLPWRTVNALFMDEQVIEGINDKVEILGRRTGEVGLSSWELLLLALWRRDKRATRRQLSPKNILTIVRRSEDVSIAGLGLFCTLLLSDTSSQWESAFFDLLDIMVSHRGKVERVAEGAVKAGSLFPIHGNFVASRRQGQIQIGRYAGRGRISEGKKERKILNAEVLDVQWIPTFALDTAVRLEIVRAGKRVELRGLRNVFVRHLREIAFVDDWMKQDALQSDVLKSDWLDPGNNHTQVLTDITEIQQAYRVATEGIDPV